jgi:hypothetical protein
MARQWHAGSSLTGECGSPDQLAGMIIRRVSILRAVAALGLGSD